MQKNMLAVTDRLQFCAKKCGRVDRVVVQKRRRRPKFGLFDVFGWISEEKVWTRVNKISSVR